MDSAPEAFSQHHWRTLLAIADAVVGTSSPTGDGLEIQPSQCPAFVELLSDTLANRIPAPAKKEFQLFLFIVSGYTGYVFNGTSAYLYDLHRDEVERIVQGWIESRLKPIRTGVKGVGYIIRAIWIRTCPGLLTAIGHPGHVVPDAAQADGGEVEDLLANARTVEYQGEQVLEISTGVLVVGSGSGATAFTHSLVRNLSSHDWRSLISSPSNVSDVLLLEKGTRKTPHPGGTPLSGDENEAFNSMVEGGGILTSDESAISVFAGSTWGGGSRINWSACLQTDRVVREEWTKHILQDMGKGGDPHGRMFLGREWQDCMEQVEEQLGVQLPGPEDHNAANKCLLEGSRKLGYTVKAVPQNISGAFADHARCGASCTIGCRGHSEVIEKKGKMSGCRAFLAPLTSAGSGPVVKGLDGFEVERVLFEGQPKRAIGVLGWAHRGQSRVRVVVRAKTVVVSSGTLNSPAILLRSGVKNPHLGYHLHLHPTLIVHSLWPKPIHPWDGTILTTVVNEFSNQDGKGHGVKLEGMCMLPSIALTYVPWTGSDAWRSRMKEFPRTMGHIVLCREEATGRVHVDATGKERISYVTGPKEREWIRHGFEGLAKLLYTQGAEEIFTGAAGLPIWRREKQGVDWADDQSFLDFLDAYKRSGFDLDRMSFGSAHQMGTCRMSGSARTGVVDVRGKVWGVDGLYVADASVFPSASGVNPMITTMAFGEWIGRRVVEGLVSGVKAEEATRARL